MLLQAADLSKPIDKRIYKGTQPTCHDFNHLTATAESVSLLVGFSAGQVQLIDPIKKETSKLFNEEVRLLLCIKIVLHIKTKMVLWCAFNCIFEMYYFNKKVHISCTVRIRDG